MKRTLLASFLLLLSTAGRSQTQPPAPPVISSPEVRADSSVTFRFRDPNAHEVVLTLEGAKPAPMQKDDEGVWSLTTGPLTPDFYGYSFVADGVSLIDPSPGRSATGLMAWSITISISLEWSEIGGIFTFTRHRATMRGPSRVTRCCICCMGSAMTPAGGRR